MGSGFTIGNAARTIPYVQQFSLGVQHELPGRILVDASDTTLNSATITRQQLLRTCPQFTGITEANYPLGRMWYNSFQLKIEKRLTHGLHLLGSYTLSKSLEAIGYLNSQDTLGSFSRVLTANDTPQRLVITGGWEPTSFRSTRGLLKIIADGWQYNAIFSVQLGLPVAAPGSAFSSGIDPKLPQGAQTTAHFFNTCPVNTLGVRQNCIDASQPVAWIQQPPYTLHTLSTRFPNIRTVQAPKADISVFKVSSCMKEFSYSSVPKPSTSATRPGSERRVRRSVRPGSVWSRRRRSTVHAKSSFR